MFVRLQDNETGIQIANLSNLPTVSSSTQQTTHLVIESNQGQGSEEDDMNEDIDNIDSILECSVCIVYRAIL